MNNQHLIYAITYIDKTTWPDGPWKLEPDKILWVDSETGYECLIRRIKEMSHLCGYVGITKEHPLHKASTIEFRSNQILQDYFSTHGGITMSCGGKLFEEEPGPPNRIGRAIVKDLPNPDEIWWIGIDFLHESDLVPIVSSDPNENNGNRIYRDVGYVSKELGKLASVLKKFQKEWEEGSLEYKRNNNSSFEWNI
jgi:hypothetical protein